MGGKAEQVMSLWSPRQNSDLASIGVLDDNKILSISNSERFNSNVRFMFEVEHLKYATFAALEDLPDPQIFFISAPL